VALAHTPELLAVLKEAGVVDAGGKGFMRMIEGVVRFIEGDPILAAPAHVRRKIEPDPRDPKYVLTIYGVGYKFVEDSE
jgi:dihydroxyacetone kinase-like predicted kinase